MPVASAAGQKDGLRAAAEHQGHRVSSGIQVSCGQGLHGRIAMATDHAINSMAASCNSGVAAASTLPPS